MTSRTVNHNSLIEQEIPDNEGGRRGIIGARPVTLFRPVWVDSSDAGLRQAAESGSQVSRENIKIPRKETLLMSKP